MKEEKKERRNRWHAMESDEAVHQLGSNESVGLSEREAVRRKRRTGRSSALWVVRRASTAHTVFGEFLDFAAILLLITAAVSAIFERGGEAVAIGVLLVVSAVIRGITTLTAQRVFEKSASGKIPRAHVIREGKFCTLEADAVVPGDVLTLSPGDIVTCDARLISGEVHVLENGLHETHGVQRKSARIVLPENTVCSLRSNMVFASSVIVSGNARAVAVAVGESTYAYARRGHIWLEQKETGVIERLSGWSRTASLIMTGVVLVITMGGLFWRTGNTEIDSLFLSALALAVASMSEFLTGIASVILACSMQMLSRTSHGTSLIQNAEAVEKLGTARFLVLTTEELLATHVSSIGTWYTDGSLRTPPETGKCVPALAHLLRLTALSTGYRPALSHSGAADTADPLYTLSRHLLQVYAVSDSFSAAPSAHAESGGLHTVLVSSDGRLLAYVCGELEQVLCCCSTNAAAGEIRPFHAGEREQLMTDARQYRQRCVRAIAVAVRLSPCNNLAKVSTVQNTMTFLGYYTVPTEADPLLAEYMAAARRGGMRVALLTEDPLRGRYLSKEAGIYTESDRYIDAVRDPSAVSRWLGEETSDCAVVHIQNQREMHSIVKVICEQIPETVCIGSDFTTTTHAASIAVHLQDRPVSAVAQQCADAVVERPTAEEPPGASLAGEAIRALGYCRNALVNLRDASEYLLLSQVMRITVMLAGVLFGLPLLTPIQILIWGLFVDYAAVLAMAFRTPRLEILSVPRNDLALPTLRHGILFPLTAGVATAVALSFCPMLLERIGVVLSFRVVGWILYGGGLLASFVATGTCLRRDRSAGFHRHTAYLAYVVLLCTIIVASGVQAGLSPELTSLAAVFVALLPAAFLAGLYGMYRHAIRSGHEKK